MGKGEVVEVLDRHLDEIIEGLNSRYSSVREEAFIDGDVDGFENADRDLDVLGKISSGEELYEEWDIDVILEECEDLFDEKEKNILLQEIDP